MKLEYGSTTLGDDTTGDKIVDHGGDYTRQVQTTPLLGGSAPFLAPRGNAANQRSFTVDKVHANSMAAVEWWNTHPNDLEASGLLRVTESYFACESVAVLVSVSRVRLDGRSTLLTYNFITKPIVATA